MNIETLTSIVPELDRLVIGYSELKKALLSAAWKRGRGLQGHLLASGPPGVGKTHTMKTFAKLVSSASGGEMGYARITGQPDLMLEEVLAERIVEYDDADHPGFVYHLGVVQALRVKESGIPTLCHFEEIDKVSQRTLNGFLELMEEQQMTLPSGETIPLNFLLVATANGRKYDKSAQELGRALQDRFSVSLEIGYLTLAEDVEVLNLHADQWRLPVRVSGQLVQGMVEVVKLTQQQLPDHTDFRRYVEVPAGPRGFLDLYLEAATEAIFAGESEMRAEHVVNVGRRVLRGRIKTTSEAEIAGKPVDVLIADILEEVFGKKMRQQAGQSGSGGDEQSQKPQQGTTQFRADLRQAARTDQQRQPQAQGNGRQKDAADPFAVRPSN